MSRQGDAPSPSTLPTRTLGPVSDLERHLPADWWKTLFNAVYLKTDGDVVEDVELTRAEVDAILRIVPLEPGMRVLDLCCGQGRHSLELARRGVALVTGLDRSRYLVRLARRRARKEGLSATFCEGDARRLRFPEDSFDLALVLGNSFGYFEQAEDDLLVLRGIRRCLRPGGTVLLDLADGAWLREHHERRSWEWVDASQFVCRERSLTEDGSRLVSREVVVDAEKGVIADQFYAERLYAREEAQELLSRAGFRDVRLHEEKATASRRNQDLGMMARRLVLTGIAPAREGGARTRALRPRVTVLLGDPRLPDPVKLTGEFGSEDLATVARLKEALSELPGRTFTYLDDHATMLETLRRTPPELVLNLCDEGWRNDARKELHVAAYLEMLGIAYTGAGPVCLGLCYDKSLVSGIAASLDIPVPLETFLGPDDLAGTLPWVFPALVKPAQGDSSVGILSTALVRDQAEAIEYLGWLRGELPRTPALVQEFLPGSEYSVTLIGNQGLDYQALPILEVDYSGLPEGLPRILSYESKWQPDSPYWTEIRYREADAPESVQRRLTDDSIKLFERLGCRDYARFDWRCDAAGTPKLLEVNPNPGWCWDGKVNLMAEMGGHRYADLLEMILEAAEARLHPC